MAVGALGVHHLRYQLAFGGQAQSELAGSGHGYLSWVTLAAAVLTAGACGVFLQRVSAARRLQLRGASRRSLLALWLMAAGALTAIYVGQESVEGLLSPGHASGLQGVFGSGGWLAIPAAVAIGGLVALVAVGAFELVAAVARRAGGHRRRANTRTLSRPAAALLPRLSPLASSHAGRAPPLQVSLT